jgi:hypothetical protein
MVTKIVAPKREHGRDRSLVLNVQSKLNDTRLIAGDQTGNLAE